MPEVEGSRPLITAARLGQQTGAAVWALRKAVPREANSSMCGVCTFPLYPPMNPTQSRKSSTAIKRILGFFGAATPATSEKPKITMIKYLPMVSDRVGLQKVFSQAAKEAFNFSSCSGRSSARFLDSLKSFFRLNNCHDWFGFSLTIFQSPCRRAACLRKLK